MLKASEASAESLAPFQDDGVFPWRRRDLAVPPAGKIALFECGREDAQAPVALLVHGLGHWTQGAWDAMAAFLQTTHRVIAFDLPGFGASEKPDARYDLPFFIATLHALVETLGLRRFALVGHSLGGMIAADYAGAYPAEVEMLVLIAPAGFLRTPKIFVRIVAGEPASRFFTLRPSRRFVRSLLEQTFYDQSLISQEMYDHAYELSQDPLVCRSFLRVYAGALRDFLDPPGFHARLARYVGPTLLVWGRNDQFIPVRALANARKVYPHADVLLLERCGHSPNVEMPAPVVQRMLSGPAPRVIYSRALTAVHYAAGRAPAQSNLPAAAVARTVVCALRAWSAERGCGRVETERNDIAYFAYDCVGENQARVVPHAAFAILSRGEKIEERAEQIRTLLSAGCELAVVLDPRTTCAILYDRTQVQRMDGADRLAHPALPGFNAPVSSFFETPNAQEA